jgi:transcriptional regulator GlxA family with amidase domain
MRLAESLLLSTVARLISDHFVPRPELRPAGWEHAAVHRAKEWLDANFEQNVALRSLADLAGLSPYYLVRAFHRQVGVPPHRYQTILRVHRARKLVASGAQLADVASLTGFCDQSHLTRCFKKTLGVTPGRYAESRTTRSRATMDLNRTWPRLPE